MSDWILPEGFRLAATWAGITRRERPDLLLVVADRPCEAALVTTRNRVVAAPVALDREQIRRSGGRVRAFLVNAGCANCGTGPEGDQDALRSAEMVAEAVGCALEEVLVFSTGVIGKRLAVDKIEAALPSLVEDLSTAPEAVDRASRAILTTDLVPKLSARPLAGGSVLGLAKGSGMIHPDMATMLGYVLTDVAPGIDLGMALRAACDRSFHMITVDGDTSTNDSVLLLSTGVHDGGAAPEAFVEALDGVCVDLAQAIARDGEGATKLVEVHVFGASTVSDARLCARTIATSPLVKTAVHGEDPNWGRILAAAGRSGAQIDTRKVRVGIGDAELFGNDRPHPEREPEAHTHLKGKDVRLWVDLGAGSLEARAWTCDYSADYVRINADYRS